MQTKFYHSFVFLLDKGVYCLLDYSWWLAVKRILKIPLALSKIRHETAEENSDEKPYILLYSWETQIKEEWGLDTRVAWVYFNSWDVCTLIKRASVWFYHRKKEISVVSSNWLNFWFKTFNCPTFVPLFSFFFQCQSMKKFLVWMPFTEIYWYNKLGLFLYQFTGFQKK